MTQGKVSDANMMTKMMDLFPEIAKAKTKKQGMSIAKSKAKIAIRKNEITANPEGYKTVLEKIKLGKAEDIIVQLPDGFTDHHVTDGPFGIDYDKQQAGTEGGHESYDDSPEAYRTRTAFMAPHLYRTLKKDGFLIWFLASDHKEWTTKVFEAAGFLVDPVPIIWDRSEGRCFSRRPDRWFGKGYDIALHCLKGNPEMVVRSRNKGVHGSGNVFRYKPLSVGEKDHIVERPPELYADIISCISIEGEKICDWFAGSGACSAAAASIKRDYFAVEMNPNHVPTIATKIFNYTPQEGTYSGPKTTENIESLVV
jgi:DNA modification methylase